MRAIFQQILIPREMKWNEAINLKQASCGATHTLLLLNDGRLFSCGNNDFGQLGHQQLTRKRPRMSSLRT